MSYKNRVKINLNEYTDHQGALSFINYLLTSAF